MKRFHRKPHAGRRKQSTEPHHWLSEGTAGQESLVSEVTPHLFAVDQWLCSTANSIAHRSDGERPFAVLVPPPDTIGWQLGFLSRAFNVYVWVEEEDDFLAEAADRFQAKLVTGDLQQELEHAVEVIIFTTSTWSSPDEFLLRMQEARQCLVDEGGLLAILRAEVGRDQAFVHFSSSEPLKALSQRSWFPLGMPEEFQTFAVPPRVEREAVRSFLRRHREFFGKNGGQLSLQEALEAEIRLQGEPSAQSNGIVPAVFGLYWRAIAVGDEEF